ncbi:sugar transporter SWEET1 [Latimeria chalumnae]|uniref:Sugar transporter SWEET1 n=1 Tax=Latimeria chalumnae TaxID=7897 RepID=H3AN52_LATCH|nr:PREDICTED: sugar transporter SWEET1 [Latimeria chalumnae]XP_006007333.1 PREDICTED: sugar transporter SWEET1 [Latimeria chalumnae]|eukprot:XP_006007332.1 PREDICTED: sugar transporter SWEET1 [Latimeria chalumnae]
MDLQLLSWACFIFTIVMFSTGLSDLKKMFSAQSTDNIQFLPFLTTDLNNLGWLYYGQLKEDWTIITVNVIGASLQTFYILAYLYYTAQKCEVLVKTLMMLAVLFLGYFYFIVVVPDTNARLNQLGLSCSVFTISMYLSPLTDLVKIIRTRSTKCLSFPLTVATFLTSTSWTLYGQQLNDFYIMIPNMPGILTSIIRFWLFWQYRSSQEKYSYRPLQA